MKTTNRHTPEIWALYQLRYLVSTTRNQLKKLVKDLKSNVFKILLIKKYKNLLKVLRKYKKEVKSIEKELKEISKNSTILSRTKSVYSSMNALIKTFKEKNTEYKDVLHREFINIKVGGKNLRRSLKTCIENAKKTSETRTEADIIKECNLGQSHFQLAFAVDEMLNQIYSTLNSNPQHKKVVIKNANRDLFVLDPMNSKYVGGGVAKLQDQTGGSIIPSQKVVIKKTMSPKLKEVRTGAITNLKQVSPKLVGTEFQPLVLNPFEFTGQIPLLTAGAGQQKIQKVTSPGKNKKGSKNALLEDIKRGKKENQNATQATGRVPTSVARMSSPNKKQAGSVGPSSLPNSQAYKKPLNVSVLNAIKGTHKLKHVPPGETTKGKSPVGRNALLRAIRATANPTQNATQGVGKVSTPVKKTVKQQSSVKRSTRPPPPLPTNFRDLLIENRQKLKKPRNIEEKRTTNVGELRAGLAKRRVGLGPQSGSKQSSPRSSISDYS